MEIQLFFDVEGENNPSGVHARGEDSDHIDLPFNLGKHLQAHESFR